MNARRRALSVLLGMAAYPVFGESRPAIRRIGYLTSAISASQREDDLRSGLKGLGWIEGRNLQIEYRRAGNSPERLADMARELVASRVELIVASTTTAVLAARDASSSLPIVTISADPVSNGFAQTLRHPGGNITGISTLSPVLSAKRLEFLKEIDPAMRRVAFLGYEPDPTHRQFIAAMQDAAKAMSIDVAPVLIPAQNRLQQGLDDVARQRCHALVVQPLLPIMGLGPAIAEFALRARLPSCTDNLNYVAAGGLLSYGYDSAVADRRVAMYVDRVLKGASPAEIPIETPQRFLLAVNQATAERMGLRIPAAIRLRAERVIA